MPARLAMATLFLFIACWIVTLLGVLLTVLFAAFFHIVTPHELGVPVTQASAYHPLLNLLVWPVFAYGYLRSLSQEDRLFDEALRLGIGL